MSVTMKNENGKAGLNLPGRITSANAAGVEQEIGAALGDYAGKALTLDLGELEYISSAGLRVLLSAQKVMNKQGEMKITGVNDVIMEIFEVTGFSDILNIV